MLNVSEKAAAVLHESLEQNEADGAEVFRIAMTDGGIALAIGAEQDGDQKIEHDRRTVLAIEPELATAFDGATIDAVETPDGLRLVFESPANDEDSEG